MRKNIFWIACLLLFLSHSIAFAQSPPPWVISRTSSSDASTLEGHAASYFQVAYASLGSIGGLTESAGGFPYFTADDTWAVRGIGTAYQVLHVNSGATAPDWTSTLGSSSTRLTMGYFTNLEITNSPTVNGTALSALYQPLDSTLTGLAGIAITVDGNNVTFPGAVITTAADGSRIIATLNNTSAPSLSANTYGWYFYGEVPYINVDGVPKPAIQKVCKTITNPSDADNMLFHIAAAGTITKISGICVGGTSAVITLQDAGADGSGSTAIDDAITIDTDGANGGAISYAIHDGDIIKLDVGAVTGAVTQLMVCYE